MKKIILAAIVLIIVMMVSVENGFSEVNNPTVNVLNGNEDSPWADIRLYGAVANDGKNDTEAIEFADAVGNALFPAGTYVVKDLVLTNPPIFIGEVTLTTPQASEISRPNWLIKFSGDAWKKGPVIGGVHVSFRQFDDAGTAVIIEGRNWIIPKIRITGYYDCLDDTNKTSNLGCTGLKFQNTSGGTNIPATHNQIGYIAVSGIAKGIEWACDNSSWGYASNNIIVEAFVVSCIEGMCYNHVANNLPATYFQNQLLHGYFEALEVGLHFVGNENSIGVSHDWLNLHFDNVTTHIKTDMLYPSTTLFVRNYAPLTVNETAGGHTNNITIFQNLGANSSPTFRSLIIDNPGEAENEQGVQIRMSSDLKKSWARGFLIRNDYSTLLSFGAHGSSDGHLNYGYIGPAYDNYFARFDNDGMTVQGTWNGTHLKMGDYHLWVDTSGNLRIKNEAPLSATDGIVVGQQ